MWENKKKAKTLREREVVLTDDEKKYLGVSHFFAMASEARAYISCAGSQPRVQVHALNERGDKGEMGGFFITILMFMTGVCVMGYPRCRQVDRRG